MVRLLRCCVGYDTVGENDVVSVIDGGCLFVEVGSIGRSSVNDC